MTEKCPYCGCYIHNKPFYVLHRQIGELQVWICPNCGKKIEKMKWH